MDITVESLDKLLINFVNIYGGMKQHDASWYSVMGTTVGGSEIAALMGRNPYSSFIDVVTNKIVTLTGGNSWTGGSEACWWGTLFEDVIGGYVSVDLGATIRGDDICIQEIVGHRNSPDGYMVARVYYDDDNKLNIWTTDMSIEIPTVLRILMLEFKCPMSRKPLGIVPKQYTPQVWSGLAVSPVAHLGLYVDAVFRKCSLLHLGDNPNYDVAYHRYDRGAWENPVAWGLIGIYVPVLDATSEPDTLFASQLFAKTQKIVDLGNIDYKLFNRVLGIIDKKKFLVRRADACFADGRGKVTNIDDFRKNVPDKYWFFGVLPWKLFEVNYIPVERRPGFMEEILPLIDNVHRTVSDALKNPLRSTFDATDCSKHLITSHKHTSVEIQDLFDNI